MPTACALRPTLSFTVDCRLTPARGAARGGCLTSTLRIILRGTNEIATLGAYYMAIGSAPAAPHHHLLIRGPYVCVDQSRSSLPSQRL